MFAFLFALTAAAALSLTCIPDFAWAGPPFFTDDPEPVELHHEEINVASQWVHERGAGTSATLPHLEVNYGAFTNGQLHVIVPFAYAALREGSAQYGLGDTELGVKYRFFPESEHAWMPQVGTFPLVDLPTGDSGKGLGAGHTNIFLPLWAQKSWGPWTTYGGGGWWRHPGEGNKDYWFGGWLLQRDLSKSITLGAEIFATTPKADGEGHETGFNAGGVFNISEQHHLLFSAGRDLSGPNSLFAYLSFLWTLGP